MDNKESLYCIFEYLTIVELRRISHTNRYIRRHAYQFQKARLIGNYKSKDCCSAKCLNRYQAIRNVFHFCPCCEFTFCNIHVVMSYSKCNVCKQNLCLSCLHVTSCGFLCEEFVCEKCLDYEKCTMCGKVVYNCCQDITTTCIGCDQFVCNHCVSQLKYRAICNECMQRTQTNKFKTLKRLLHFKRM